MEPGPKPQTPDVPEKNRNGTVNGALSHTPQTLNPKPQRDSIEPRREPPIEANRTSSTLQGRALDIFYFRLLG